MASNGGNGPAKKRNKGWSEPQPHEEYLELAAASTAGDLTDAEQTTLREHLAVCADCRQALHEFESVADMAVPMLASELGEATSLPGSSASPENVRAKERKDSVSAAAAETNLLFASDSKTVPISQRNGHRRTQMNWNLAWIPLAASILLTAALGIYAYRVGIGRGIETARLSSVPRHDALDARSGPGVTLEALEQQISDAGHEREILQGQMAERDRVIKDLRGQIQAQNSTLGEIRMAQATLESSLQRDEAEKQQRTAAEQKSAEERKNLDQNLEAAEASLQKSQQELYFLRQQRSFDRSRSESLEAQIRDLHGQLHDREQAINKDEELLAHDKDIRDLMGARDLYIAEVYDVGRDGATQKPYGRVFYTKGKSLVFYAYDLDQQAGAKNATFQAWGRRGPDQQALNLGILYKDTVGKKRWVLKFDDEKALDQIDAVFVTLEPDGQSHKPSGKSLLFAYLKVNPNHP